MSNTLKVVVTVIVVLIIALALYFWYAAAHSNNAANRSADVSAPFSSGTSNMAMLPGGASNSDAALTQDTAAIDAQMNGLASDNANTNTSLNDQPLSQ